MAPLPGQQATTTRVASVRAPLRGFLRLLAPNTPNPTVSVIPAALRTSLASYCCRAWPYRPRCWERNCEADAGFADCRRMRTEEHACRADCERHAVESRQA